MGLIRFFLALIVVIAHTDPFFGFEFLGGKTSVQAFYIISGFYMALILNEKYVGINNSYKLFLTNRLIRLYPVYWTVLILIILLSLTYGFISDGENFVHLNRFKDNHDQLSPITFVILIFSNVFIFFQDALLFFEINPANGLLFFQPKFNPNALNGFDFALIPQAWTVSLELLFYLIAPFIVRRKTSSIIYMFTVLLILRILMKHVWDFNYTPWNFRFFPIELTFFLLGILSYKLYKSKQLQSINNQVNIMVFVGLLLLVLCYDKIHLANKNELFFLLFFIAIPFIFNLTKKSKLDRYIGELSYPIYIIHMFIISIGANLEKQHFHLNNIMLIIISIVAAIFLKHFVSDRIEVYRQNRVK